MASTDPHSPYSVGLLLTTTADHPSFASFCRCAWNHLAKGHPVYAYLLHDAVTCAGHPELQTLQTAGLKLHACAAAALQRHLNMPDSIILSGLGSLAQIILHTDVFQTFSSHETHPDHHL